MRRPSSRSSSVPGRPGPRVAVAGAAIVLVLVAVVLLSGTGGSGGGDARADACRALQGDLRPDAGGARCDVPRTAFTTERVRLRPDGTVDPADARVRRAACARDARSARDRAVAAARTRTVGAYASYRWATPGVCRASRATLPAATAAGERATRLLEQADRAQAVDPAAALRLARRADAVMSSTRSRAAIARARAALEPSEPRPSTQLVSPNEYLGIDCASIGREFRVAPGSDPAHDPDGDGRACEGE
ncbi:hypothetical protein [Patulibacter sp.]|uniref:hypothetical protein n=1 Tax=Patulibacter sp. TaxID=1912859 RepID=UPI00271C84B0|nr:hypothetical protein [Patulibacter sp.]MDO9407651.1 hypothetical protein [Patulibacter sp.]